MHHAYFNAKAELAAAREDMKKQKVDKGYIDRMVALWQERESARAEYCCQVPWQSLPNLPTDELLRIYKKFCVFDYSLWELAVHIELFDPCGEQIITDVCREYAVRLPAADQMTLLTPPEPSILQQEEINIVRIALMSDSEQGKALARHQAEYWWLKSDWAEVVALDEAYFQKRLDIVLAEPEALLREQIQKFEMRGSQLLQSQVDIAHKYGLPPALQSVYYWFRRMAYWRDLRKRAAMINNRYYKLLGQECARRAEIDFSHFCFLMPDEVFDSQLTFSAAFRNELQQRSEHSIYYIDRGGQPVTLAGEEYLAFMKALAHSFNSKFSDIKGMIACKGQVQGHVKIINVPADFDKMKPCDILVAPMTRPEYMPLLRLASAIVTDEGGITSHAAIISRELGIPCIIGTQVATEILSDGELVEVDANRGIIHRLESL